MMADSCADESSAADRSADRASDSIPFMSMGAFLLATQLLALMLATPFESAGIKAFEDPSSMWNPVYFITIMIALTALILLLVKIGVKNIVHLFMLGAIAVTLYYVFCALLPVVQGIAALPLIAAIALTALLYVYPEWYVVDAVGLLIGAGVASIFGISLEVLPVIVLLVMLAAYDAIAVYRTKHMVSLAESVIEMRIPILFVVPKSRKFSLIAARRVAHPSDHDAAQAHESKRVEERMRRIGGDAFFMGLGDAIIPGVLAVSAYRFVSFLPALCAVAGTLAGYAILCTFAGRGKPHAGLPFLNTGAIVGFLIGLAIA